MPTSEQRTLRIPEEYAGQRLDQVLAELIPDYSRSRLQRWIRAGKVLVDFGFPRTRAKVRGGEQVAITVDAEPADTCVPQPIPLTIVHEDAALLVIDKPAGMVAHPAVGNREGTLQNALLYYAPELAALPRGGLVHRLDKDTTGLVVVARTLAAHKRLMEALEARRITREYRALVVGQVYASGRIEAPLGRHPVERKHMAVVAGGRRAVTHYRVVRRLRAHTLLDVRLETGRTHQIRVHMAHIRHPVFGDPLYGGRLRIPPGIEEHVAKRLRNFKRQALHARRLALEHPETGQPIEWHTPLPDDFLCLLDLLKQDAEQEGDL
jgi:pseudouridine synthase, RluA family